MIGGCRDASGGGSSTNCTAVDTVEVLADAAAAGASGLAWAAGPSLRSPRHGFGVGLCLDGATVRGMHPE